MSQNVVTFDLTSSEPAQVAVASEFKLGHRTELDGLRGISILMVLLLHFGFKFMPGGFLGVDIFFVLSGFLITSLLIQEKNRHGRISLKAFYIRRALRLTPALILYILVLALFALVFMKRDKAVEIYQGILLTLSYVSNWIFAFNPRIKIGPLGITWSLAIEEQFYFVWPLVLSIAFRLKAPKRVVLYGLILTTILVALHRKLLLEGGAIERRLYYATDTRADALLIGCLVALLLAWDLIPRSRVFRWGLNLTASAGFLLVAYMAGTASMGDLDLYLGLFTLVSMSIGAILIVLMLWPPAWALQILRVRPLTWIGRISYGVYLWHWPIREIICPKIETASTGRIIAAALVSVTAAALSFYLVETPFLRLKERFARSEGKSVGLGQRELLTAGIPNQIRVS